MSRGRKTDEMVEDSGRIASCGSCGGLVHPAVEPTAESAAGRRAFKENSFVFLGESGIIILTVHPEIWV